MPREYDWTEEMLIEEAARDALDVLNAMDEAKVPARASTRFIHSGSTVFRLRLEIVEAVRIEESP